MPVWPGDFGVSIERVSKIEEGSNANVSHLALGAHTGTHVDAPYHFIQGGVTLDMLSLELFIGPGEVVEVPDADLVTRAELDKLKIGPQTTRILFKTKNSLIWSRQELKFQENFTALSPDAAQCLVDRGIQLVGIDYLSIAPFRDSGPTHNSPLCWSGYPGGDRPVGSSSWFLHLILPAA